MEQPQKSAGEILHSLNPHAKDKPIVESSARVYERQTGKLPGNAGAKLGAYVTRIESLLSDDRTKEHLLGLMAENLTIAPNDIPESYWNNQIKKARSHGVNLALSRDVRALRTDIVRSVQFTGADRWVRHLNDSEQNYPTWFQLYALDGLSRMGAFDPQAGQYKVRRRDTTTPYPYLNKQVLDKTFQTIQSSYEQEKRDNVAMKGSSFNKIYSRFLLEDLSRVELPDSPEDVQGDWKEYTYGMVDELIDASQGTVWCTAGTEMANYYLSDPSEKFYIFHAKDAQTGAVDSTGLVAIHTQSGIVDEVVGQKSESQDIHDVLMPEVVRQLSALPGGNHYIKAIRDNGQLNNMDKKFSNGEEFTIDELLLLYEVNDRIYTIYDKSPDWDPRVQDFKRQSQRHEEQFAKEFGADNARWMVMHERRIIQQLDAIMVGDVDINDVTKKLSPMNIMASYDVLVNYGAAIDVEGLVVHLKRKEIEQNMAWISEHTSIDFAMRCLKAVGLLPPGLTIADIN